MSAALLMLREGLEASLVVGIVLAYLTRTGRPGLARRVWIGTGAAIAASIATGAALFFTIGELEGTAEKLFEGATMLSAVVVTTWMIFWMRRQAGGIKLELESRVAGAVAAGSAIGLVSVAFFAVLREGWESALFLFAISESTSPASTAAGAAIGLALAIGLGVAFYHGSRRLNLRMFFTITGVLLIVFAAGLLAHAVHEFQEAGVLPEGDPVWSTGSLVSGSSTTGEFLKALVGYNDRPSALEVGVWLGYLGLALPLFLAPLVRLRRARPVATAA